MSLKMDKYNHQSKEHEYLALIKSTEENQQINMIRLCLHRMPESYALLERLWMHMRKSIVDSIPATVKREMIKEIDRAIARYQLKCDINELNKVKTVINDVNTVSEQVLRELSAEEEKRLQRTVNELMEKAEALGEDPDNQNLLQQIQELDESINKKRLEQYPEFEKKYKKCSEMLLLQFQKAPDEKEIEKEKTYNHTAINAHSRAWEIFNERTLLHSLKEKGNTVKDGFEKFVNNNLGKGKLRTIEDCRKAWEKIDPQDGMNLLREKGRSIKESAESIIDRKRAVKAEIVEDQDVEIYVELMGGWNHQYLMPSTLMYTNSIYTRIFSKLSFQDQLLMTRQMVDVEAKLL